MEQGLLHNSVVLGHGQPGLAKPAIASPTGNTTTQRSKLEALWAAAQFWGWLLFSNDHFFMV
jgi:hypothetical protein